MDERSSFDGENHTCAASPASITHETIRAPVLSPSEDEITWHVCDEKTMNRESGEG
jgi:hypothetical protein